MKEYNLICIVGKAGSGKDTLLKQVLSLNKWNNVIPFTSRPIRENEREGNPYHFLSTEEIQNKILDDEALGLAVFNDWIYGYTLDAFKKDTINIGVFNLDAVDALLRDQRFNIRIVFIDVLAKERMLRQLNREEDPDVNEIVRRYKADYEDFYHVFTEFHIDEVVKNNTPLDLVAAANKIQELGKSM